MFNRIMLLTKKLFIIIQMITIVPLNAQNKSFVLNSFVINGDTMKLNNNYKFFCIYQNNDEKIIYEPIIRNDTFKMIPFIDAEGSYLCYKGVFVYKRMAYYYGIPIFLQKNSNYDYININIVIETKKYNKYDYQQRKIDCTWDTLSEKDEGVIIIQYENRYSLPFYSCKPIHNMKSFLQEGRDLLKFKVSARTKDRQIRNISSECETSRILEKSNNEYERNELHDTLQVYQIPADTSVIYEDFNINGVNFKMIYVEGGTFTMGSTEKIPRYNNEIPAHRVTVDSYYIGETEVTQALWKAVMGNNPSKYIGDYLPVDFVSWNDCQTFISRLNQLTGKKFRLPTEAEWEYAAKGGNKSKGYKYAGSNIASEVAWYEEDIKKPHLVGTKKANELGIYDMSGNVYEWCQDWYGSYSGEPQKNPQGPLSGKRRIVRSCSWFDYEGCCEITRRGDILPEYGSEYRGFRIVLEP